MPEKTYGVWGSQPQLLNTRLRLHKLSAMLPFSQRHGFKPIRQSLQIDSIDKSLKNGLWNAYNTQFLRPYRRLLYRTAIIEEYIWTEFLKREITSFNDQTYESEIHLWYSNYAQWFRIYEFVEFCYNILDSIPDLRSLKESYTNEFNRVLEREMSAYRLLDGLLSRITSEVEIDAIEEATRQSEGKWKPVTEHLRTALILFSNRQSPDYRNSVKESISAVESASKLITGDDKTTLGQALKVLESKGQIHPSLKGGFDKLYGYTSDKGGIRHAMLDDTNSVSFDEAKFMLVACSAFINYLRPHLP